nr:unnamed protein product [Digitaria exilis]
MITHLIDIMAPRHLRNHTLAADPSPCVNPNPSTCPSGLATNVKVIEINLTENDAAVVFPLDPPWAPRWSRWWGHHDTTHRPPLRRRPAHNNLARAPSRALASSSHIDLLNPVRAAAALTSVSVSVVGRSPPCQCRSFSSAPTLMS